MERVKGLTKVNPFFYIISMQKKYNYNRHLCKKIDKLEDFTVEYKNDPFKALKLFIDSYL